MTHANDPGPRHGGGAGPRVVLLPPSRLHELDGGWWPRSRRLAEECVALVDHLPAELGRVDRIIYSRPDWDPEPSGSEESSDPTRPATRWPRKIALARGWLKTGSFPRDDTHIVVLLLAGGRRMHLLVIPADTEPARARALLAAAGDPDDQRSAAELLTTAAAAGANALSTWEDEGGSCAARPLSPAR